MYKKIQINDFRLFKNKTIMLGKLLTIVSGRNSTGKSTILGMIANSGELKKKDGVTYTSKPFRAEFSELFKGSKKYDNPGTNRFEITLCDEDGNEIDYRSFRTAWQAKEQFRNKKDNDSNDQQNNIHEERFRVIPFKKLKDGKKTEAKFNYPVLYLGLSRLFPIGESKDNAINTKRIIFKSEEHKKWYIEKYEEILSMQTKVKEITNYSIGETDKKSGIGVTTDDYDYLTNSSGQDNLGQILLALLSFKKLKEERGDNWAGGVLLVDEIDATLHPAAQNKLIEVLIQEARKNKLQIVLTTHSLSFLKNICQKIVYNCFDDNVSNDIELYYLTNANRKLEIKRNPFFTNIENDLMITSLVQKTNKIKLYSEDAEARWFLNHLVEDDLIYVDELNITIGCDQLINLYNTDLQYFGNMLIVFDGDVTEKQLNKISENIRANLGNIIKLPGNVSPERLIYEYILSLGPEHDFWSSGAQRIGFTWDYFKEHGPDSSDYRQDKERERYKKWFVDHKQYFNSTKLINYWIEDNKILVGEFQKQFREAYNKIAKRTMAISIDN